MKRAGSHCHEGLEEAATEDEPRCDQRGVRTGDDQSYGWQTATRWGGKRPVGRRRHRQMDGNLCDEHLGPGPAAKQEQRPGGSTYHPIENHKREVGGVPSLEAHQPSRARGGGGRSGSGVSRSDDDRRDQGA
jgi:hypothetical protein